jgi:ABC-2 type transport system ATP-binding protein
LADEPTVGVDPQSRNHIFERVEELARQGKAVVYTTHYMEEVERLCNRIAIVDHGRVVAEGTLEELLAHVTKTQTLRVQLSKGQAVKVSTLEGEGHQDFEGFEDLDMEGRGRVSAELEERFSPLRCGFEGSLLELSFKGPPPITDLVFWFAERKLSVTRMETDRPTLEDAFLELTGRSLRDG